MAFLKGIVSQRRGVRDADCSDGATKVFFCRLNAQENRIVWMWLVVFCLQKRFMRSTPLSCQTGFTTHL